MTEEQKEDIKLLKELIADTNVPNDDREIYQEALNQILAETKSDMPKAEETKTISLKDFAKQQGISITSADADEQEEKSVRKKPQTTQRAKQTTKPKKAITKKAITKKAKAVKKSTPLPSDVDAMKKAIKERTGKTEAECEDIIAQYRKLRAKAKVNNAKRTEKLKSNDDLITGTNVITPVAQIEKDAEIVKAKIEKQVEQIENKAEREVVKKDKTKDEVKVEVEQKVVKQLAKLSDDMVSSATTFVKNIQTELKKVDKTEAKNFLLGLRNEIDALLSKFGDGGSTIETYNITENESASSVNPSLFARGGGVNANNNDVRVKALIKNLDNTPYSIGLAILRERLLTYTENDLRVMEKKPTTFDNPIISRGMYKDYFNRVIEELKFDYENGGEVGEFAKGGGVGKKYILLGYSATASRDTYEDGELESVGDWNVSGTEPYGLSKEFSNKKDLIDYINEKIIYVDYQESDFDWESGEGKNIQTDVLCSYDDYNGYFPASEEEKKLWKKGKKDLFNVHYFINVQAIIPTSYKTGGGVSGLSVENLEKRLSIVQVDVKKVLNNAPNELLDYFVEGYENIGTLLSNIEIASDLTDNESDSYYEDGGSVDEKYKVVKVFRKSGRREVLEKNLTLEQARRVVERYPNSNTSMVVFMKMYSKGGGVGNPSKKQMLDYLNMYFDNYSELRTIAIEEDNILTRRMLNSLDNEELQMAYDDAKYEIKAETQFDNGGAVDNYINAQIKKFRLEAKKKMLYEKELNIETKLEIQGFLALDSKKSDRITDDYLFYGESFSENNLMKVLEMFPNADYISFDGVIMGKIDNDYVDGVTTYFEVSKLKGKFAKGGRIMVKGGKLPEWAVTITSEDGDTYDWVGFANNEDDALYKAEMEAGFESVESGVTEITDSKGNKIEYAGGGNLNDIDYNEILEVLKEKLEDSIQELPIHYENADDFKGEEVEHESRDGFIPYTNGGYQVTWFEFVYNLGYSGYSLPTSQLDIEMQRQMDYNDKIAKDRFVEEYAEIVEELGIDNIDYHSLYEAGYESEAEQLSEWEMNYDADDSILCEIGAYYYDTENYRGINGKNTIRLYGLVNLESPYHRRGNLDDSYDIDITFDSISELKEKIDAGLKEITNWFDGKYYKDSNAEMKITRMAKGGGIGRSDKLYIFKVYNLNDKLVDKSRRIFARNLLEAKEIAILIEDEMHLKYGRDLRFKIEEAPSMMAKGGGVLDNNTFVNVLFDYGFSETRGHYSIRNFRNMSNGYVAFVDMKNKNVEVFKDAIKGTNYSGFSIQQLIDFLNKNGFIKQNKFDKGGSVDDYIDEKENQFANDEYEMREIYGSDYKDIEHLGFLAIDDSLRDNRLSEYLFEGEEFSKENLLEVAKMYPQAKEIYFGARIMGENAFGIEEDGYSEIDDIAMVFDMDKLNQFKKGGVTGKDNRAKKVVRTINGKKRKYPIGDAWKKEHNEYNESEKYEIPISSRKS